MRTFSIPKEIGRQRLVSLPMSARLRDALLRLGIQEFQDLDGLTGDILRADGANGDLLTLELEQLISRVERRMHRAHLLCGRPPKPPEPVLAVAPRFFEVPIPQAPIGARLTKILDYMNVRKAGDLNGLHLSDFARLRSCGPRTLQELRELVRNFQDNPQPEPPSPVKPNELIQVPRHARKVRFSELPISTRLEGVLNSIPASRIGDLSRLTWQQLSNLDNCGLATLRELRILLHRAFVGDFSLKGPASAPLSPAGLLAHIAEYLNQLSSRDLKILELRLGDEKRPPMTLLRIAQRFRVSSEAIRQIQFKHIHRVYRGGGPRVKACLDTLAQNAAETVHPLMAENLKDWLPQPWPLAHSPSFYLGLIHEMRPDVPVWASHVLVPSSLSRQSVMVEWLRLALKPAGKCLTFKEAFEHLQNGRLAKKFTVPEFLQALRQEPEFQLECSPCGVSSVRFKPLRQRSSLLASRPEAILQAPDPELVLNPLAGNPPPPANSARTPTL